MNKPACDECIAIALEIRAAYLDTWMSADQDFREAWLAIRKLKGGTEEDVARLEELLPRARLRTSPRIGNAVLRRLVHETRAGHRVALSAD